MLTPENVLGGAIIVALVLYLLFGGADFGGGVWDLLASGPRRDQQRALIEHAVGPVWETNHVWLILAVVIVFTAFPRAFAALSIAFHWPLVIFLFGIVLRGSSFAFRSYDSGRRRERYGLAFSMASVVSPVMLGIVVGAAASGRVEIGSDSVGSSFDTWLAPFPIATGFLTLALCAYLAATYLTHEAGEGALAEDFRWRALAAGGVVAFVAIATLGLTFRGAPEIAEALTHRPWAFAVELAAAVSATLGFFALVRRRYGRARVFVAAQVSLIVVGWAAAQYPYLVVDDLTLTDAAAGPRTLELLLYALLGGLPILLPSLFLLFRVFKGERVA